MGSKKIKISCKTEARLPIGVLEDFQGDLKTIEPESLENLKNSILKYGFSFPIFVWENKILDGHQRLEAVKSLGEKGIMPDEDMLPVVWIEAKNEKEAAEKLLLINSRYAKIDQSGFDLFVENFDLDIADLSDMLDIPEVDFSFEDESFEGNTDPDDIPEVEETPVTKMGDIWLLGSHRLMCGDSTKIEDVERLMDGQKADMVFCDPPYGVSYADKNVMLNAISRGNRIQTRIENDHKSVAEMKDFWTVLFANLHSSSSKKAAYYLIAAQQTGRKCYAMEISPQYVDVAIKRWQDFTGEDAVLERTGETFEMIKNAVTS